MTTSIHDAPTLLSGQTPARAPALRLADTDASGPPPGGAATDAGEEQAAGERGLPARIDRYLVIRELGAGGMGRVVEAFDPELDRRVAIKLLRSREGGPSSQARLLREAQAMARLSHPNVVQVHDVGLLGQQVFLAMEMVDGTTLTTWQAGRAWREVVAMYLEAGRGLAAAHAVGLVHRDFKPDNVLIGRDGRARVADFGLAREDLGAEAATTRADNPGERPLLAESLTATGAVMGTPVYMSPEQHAGLKAGPASDQFSFCVALYEALHGARPFAGETMAELGLAVMAGTMVPAPPGRRAPRAIEAALRRGLSVRPADRHASFDVLLAELARPLRRGRGWLIGGIAAASLCAAGAGYAAQSREVTACSGAAEEIAAVWSEEAGAAIAARAQATGLAAEDAERVAAGLSNYAAAWAESHRDACLDHRRGENSSATLDLRTRCLERRKDALAAAVSVLSQADAAAMRQASLVIAKLPPIAQCADIDALAAEVPPPSDATLAEEVEGVRRSLTHAQVVANSGDVAGALREVAEARARGRALPYRPLQAEVALNAGRLEMQAQDYPRAEAELREAFIVATATRQDAIAAEAKARELFVHAGVTGRADEALAERELAEALVERAGGRRDLAALLATTLGNLLFETDGAAAAGEFRRALELSGDGAGLDPIDYATGTLTNAAILSEDPGERARLFDRAAAVLARSLGPRHLSTLQLRMTRAGREDDPGRAEDQLSATCPVVLADHPTNWEACDDCHRALAEALADLGEAGRSDAALADQERCLSVEAPEIDREPMQARLAVVKGRRALLAGRPEEALAGLDSARSLAAPYVGMRWVRLMVADIDVARGQAMLALARAGEAAAALEPALTTYVEVTPFYGARTRRGAARTRLALATALWADAGARARALELVAAAEAYYREVGDAAGSRRVTEWRAAHP